MNTKLLLVGGITAATVLAGGWALAQTQGHDHGATGSAQQHTHGMGPHGMGHGHMQQRMGQQHTGRQHMGQYMGHGQMQQQGHGGMGHGMMQHKGRMGAGKGMMQHQGMQHQGGAMGPGMQGGAGQTPFDPARLATLKTELAITAAQEAAWTKYTTAVQDAATAMATTRAGIDRDSVRNMTPQDRFAFVTKIREQAQARFTAVRTAANDLLAVLDDTQKTKARDILPGLAFGPGRSASAGHQHRH